MKNNSKICNEIRNEDGKIECEGRLSKKKRVGELREVI